MSAEFKARRRDHCLILVMSNPGACNTLHADMYAAAIETLSTAERDDSVKAVILTGADDCFCAGIDAQTRPKQLSAQTDTLDRLHSWIEALHDCPKPVIAAVEGTATGAGFSLALACDLIVAGASATFAMSYVRHVLTPDSVAPWLLLQALPRQLASEILLQGLPFTATRLQQLGIVNRLVTDGAALDCALAWAEQLAELSPAAIERNKALIHSAAAGNLQTSFESVKRQYLETLGQHQVRA